MSVENHLADYEQIEYDDILDPSLRAAEHVVPTKKMNTQKNGPSPVHRPRAHSPSPPVLQPRSRNHSPEPPAVRPRSRNHTPEPPALQPRSRNHSPEPPVLQPRSRNHTPEPPAIQPRSRNHSPELPTMRAKPHSTDSPDVTGLSAIKGSKSPTKKASNNPTKNTLQPSHVGTRSMSPRRRHNNDSSTTSKLKEWPDYQEKPNTPNSFFSNLSSPSATSSIALPLEGGKNRVSTSSDDGERLMLPDLVRKYSKCLPLRVCVEEGYCGSEERFVISSGDIYNFHFVRSEKMASIQDGSKRHFSIPFNSDIKFGLLFDPYNDFNEALTGHTFVSVSELVASKTMPKVIAVVTSSQTQNGDRKSSLVEPNEILTVKKIGKTILRKPFLKVYSHTTKEEKTLLDDCDASFTTEPYEIKLYLPDLLEQFTGSLPLEAMMFTAAEDMEALPLHLTTEKIVISHTSIESAIIATTCWDLEDTDMDLNSDSEDNMAISIPIEMEIEVTLLNVDQDDLYLRTKSLLSDFDNSKVKQMKVQDKSDENMVELKRCQNSLSKKIRPGYEFRGVDITMSDKVYDGQAVPFKSVINQPLPPLPKTAQLQPAPQYHPNKKHDCSPKRIKIIKEEVLLPSLDNRIPKPPVRGQSLDDRVLKDTKKNLSRLKSASDDMEEGPICSNQSPLRSLSPNFNLNPPMTTPSSTVGSDDDTQQQHLTKIKNPSEDDDIIKLGLRVNSLKTLTETNQNDNRKQLGEVREEVKLLTDLVEGLRAECKFLRMELEEAKGITPKDSITTEPPSLPAAQTTTAIVPLNPEQEEENLKVLRALSQKQIINLLDAMKLTQYKESFEEECIDGEVFAECDENILEKELRIHNRLHRTRLMKLITGRHSTQYYFTDDYDPYGRLLTLV